MVDTDAPDVYLAPYLQYLNWHQCFFPNFFCTGNLWDLFLNNTSVFIIAVLAQVQNYFRQEKHFLSCTKMFRGGKS